MRRRDGRRRPRQMQRHDAALLAQSRMVRTWLVSDHAADRLIERCPLARTFSRSDARARIVELLATSTRWGFGTLPEWPRRAAAFRALAWGPFRLVAVVQSRDGHAWAVKTVLDEAMAQKRLLALMDPNPAGEMPARRRPA